MDQAESHDERTTLALQVVELARSEVIAAAPFLAAATGELRPTPARQATALATDGTRLLVDPGRVLADFARTRRAPVRAYAHTLLHCILLHPFARDVRLDAWGLAADVVAYALVEELMGAATPAAPEPGAQTDIEKVYRQLARKIAGPLTTERLYHLLLREEQDGDIEAWRVLFEVDGHKAWPAAQKEEQAAGAQPRQQDPAAGDQPPAQSGLGGADAAATEAGGEEALRDEGAREDADASFAQADPALPAREAAEAEEDWRRLAQQVRVDIEGLARKRGTLLESLVGELSVSDHKERDYREFLRQFATSSEELHLSDDEFDYVFYTYGLELYDDMPLIEPLEYRQERRIRDFAIVIDTSSSVTRKVVQDFIDATYDVLTSEGGFFEQVCIHIIQADVRVQSDTRISSAADLEHWRRHIELRGMGGTDFRPAISYVRRLQLEGEFDDLRGLIYFTDGWGLYPTQAPPFPCAFVFYDEDHRPDLVPAWGEQLVLHPGEFESMSVY